MKENSYNIKEDPNFYRVIIRIYFSIVRKDFKLYPRLKNKRDPKVFSQSCYSIVG